MKNHLLIVTILIVIFICDTSLAAEIRFKELEWGISFDDAQIELNNQGFYITPFSSDYIEFISVEKAITNQSSKYYDGSILLYGFLDGLTTENMSIAGYDDWLSFVCFAKEPENGRIDTSTVNHLYLGAYIRECQDGKNVFQDMLYKLSSIYGDPIYPYDDEKSLQYETETAVWEGDNDASIVMRAAYKSESDSSSDDELTLYYVWNQGDQYFDNAEEVYLQNLADDEAANFNNGDTSGL